jgi:hypothetical protein
MCSEGKALDNGHNSARNMLSSVQVNKQNLLKIFKVIVLLVGVLPHFNYLEDARNHEPKKNGHNIV